MGLKIAQKGGYEGEREREREGKKEKQLKKIFFIRAGL